MFDDIHPFLWYILYSIQYLVLRRGDHSCISPGTRRQQLDFREVLILNT